ncbi:hypothetical protein [Stenotrophomonas phage IME-SM1]|uniref:Uncharacterized protein n=2 Tax=Menderavirus IMESM1 TaxID=2846388 RepID=A0A0H4IP42_9CAUD|nr:hypothetical protein HWC11_gp107 [Stenotrophomonas phage YB07]YP_010077935.1 hypothetical protein KMC40_gp016 [Stenotrophomonas phage IME-SM1]QXN67476.1 hypothetical protein [Stenotrophomonas phage BUCT608]AKO61742.1 hypothetical protein [Stenotrophomonas phage IME-SM1]QBP06303.1 hypothetical protein [Stenotrophomonas phage YB07]QYC97614.1 hypothetical protein [Stenotrophomonas phage BUCT608]
MNSIFGEFAAPRDNKMPRQGNDPLVALVESASAKKLIPDTWYVSFHEYGKEIYKIGIQESKTITNRTQAIDAAYKAAEMRGLGGTVQGKSVKFKVEHRRYDPSTKKSVVIPD